MKLIISLLFLGLEIAGMAFVLTAIILKSKRKSISATMTKIAKWTIVVMTEITFFGCLLDVIWIEVGIAFTAYWLSLWIEIKSKPK